MAESIEGVLSRINFHKRSKWNPSGTPYLIGQLRGGLTVKGELARPRVGENYRFWGSMKPQKGYQDAFEFYAYDIIVDDSVDGVTQFLKTYIKGIGIVRAAAIAEHFGAETLPILRMNPDRAAEVQGITPEIVQAIKDHFSECKFDPAAYAALADLFAEHRFPKKLILKLLEHWGSDAPRKVKENPYLLLAYPRMGWKGVDAFAIDTAEYDRAGLERQKAAILEALERIHDEGHTWAEESDINFGAAKLIGRTPDSSSWAAVLEQQDVAERVTEDFTVQFALSKIAYAEETIAHRLSILSDAPPLPFDLDAEGLSDEQRAALKIFRDHALAILVGGPGTGKSWSVTSAIANLLANGVKNIRIMAPTGKAAKRAEELLRGKIEESIPCTTVHRALGPIPSEAEEGVPSADSKVGRGRDEFGFAHNEDDPIEAEFIVIDECSMVDVSLCASLLKAVAPGTRVVIVGDPHQLPSVGPGSVLRDLIDAGVPTARLTTPRRNSGRIVRACHQIKDGIVPEPSPRLDLEAGENWIHLEIPDPHEAAQRICELHASAARNGRFDPFWDMQVVAAQKNTAGVGCDNLNRLLSRQLNRRADLELGGQDGNGSPEEDFAPRFSPGDKVVRTKNGMTDQMIPVDGDSDQYVNWTWQGRGYHFEPVEVVNGDLGSVLDVVEGERQSHVVVSFRNPERLVRMPIGECRLQLAYAMTVHKCQGSGFPYVIVPVSNRYYWDSRTQTGLWNRELVYTAFSRAERVLVTVGEFSAIEAAVSRKTVNRRRTRLAELVRQSMEPSVNTQP